MKNNQNMAYIVLVVIITLASVFAGAKFLSSTDGNAVTPNPTAGVCGSDLASTVTFTARNGLNTSGTQDRDQTAYVYEVVNGQEVYIATQSDLTAGSFTGGQCGKTYRVRLVSTSGSQGALIEKSVGANVIDGGKAIEFVAGTKNAITITTKDISGVKAKLYDNTLKGDVYDGSDASATDYEVTGATFKSTTGNTTAMAIGLDESIDVTFSLRAISSYTDVADLGMYILLDAPITAYDTPVLRFNGVELVEATGLTDSESKAYSDYEYVYKVMATAGKPVIASNSDATLEVEIPSISGVNPSSDVVVAFAPIGSKKATTSDSTIYASVDDSSSRTAIHTLQSFTIDIS